MWTVADLLWYAYGTADGFRPVLSAADALYLLGLVPAALGLVLYPVGTWEPGARARLLLDVVVLGGALLLVSQVLVLGEVVATVGVSWDAFVYVVYPVTDVLLAGLAMLLLLRSSGDAPRSTWPLIAARVRDLDGRRTTGTPCCRRGAWTTSGHRWTSPTRWPRRSSGWRRCTRASDGRSRSAPSDGTSPAGSRCSLPGPGRPLAALATCVVTGLHGRTEWVLAATVLALTGARQFARTIDNEQPAHASWSSG